MTTAMRILGGISPQFQRLLQQHLSCWHHMKRLQNHCTSQSSLSFIHSYVHAHMHGNPPLYRLMIVQVQAENPLSDIVRALPRHLAESAVFFLLTHARVATSLLRLENKFTRRTTLHSRRIP